MTTSTRLPAPGKQFFFPGMIVPFVLIACCFAAWGLAQDLTTPLVAAFQGIFTMSTFEASLASGFHGGVVPTGGRLR
ncbi:MAG: hypothetical protein ACTHW5_10605, partial [Microbacterium sp.]